MFKKDLTVNLWLWSLTVMLFHVGSVCSLASVQLCKGPYFSLYLYLPVLV